MIPSVRRPVLSLSTSGGRVADSDHTFSPYQPTEGITNCRKFFGLKPARAIGFVQRTRGLAWKQQVPPGYALQIDRCRAVHTFGMRFPLDLLWLDGEERVVRVDYCVPPRRLRSCKQARSVVEVTAGEGRDLLESGYTAAR